MPIVRRSPTSRKDLLAIWLHIAEDSIPGADAVVDRIESAIALLSRLPRAGPARPELYERLRSYPVGSYVLFYKPMRGGIQLVRVIHGARDLRRLFRRRRRG